MPGRRRPRRCLSDREKKRYSCDRIVVQPDRATNYFPGNRLPDAILSGIAGLLLILGATPLTSLLGLPVGLLRGSGLILIPFTAGVAWLGTRDRLRRPLVFAVVACNALWALDSLLLLTTGWVQPTVLGGVVVFLQAALVAALGELEFIGLRRSTLVESHART